MAKSTIRQVIFIYLFIYLFIDFTITGSGRLAEIWGPVCISKSKRTFYIYIYADNFFIALSEDNTKLDLVGRFLVVQSWVVWSIISLTLLPDPL